jgi:hypothetical protein
VTFLVEMLKGFFVLRTIQKRKVDDEHDELKNEAQIDNSEVQANEERKQQNYDGHGL